MPTYEYKCSKCGLEFEVSRSINSTEEVICQNPQCTMIAFRHFRTPAQFTGHSVPSRKRFYHMKGKNIGKKK